MEELRAMMEELRGHNGGVEAPALVIGQQSVVD